MNILTPRPATSSTNRTRSQADIARERHNKAKELFETRSDLRPFISVSETGTAFGVMPVGGRRGPTQQQFDEIRNFIFGTTPAVNTGGNNAPTTTNKIQKEIPGIPGSLAESTDGGKTWKRIK